MNAHLQQLPAYLTVAVANALPVWGALNGRLVFFQVLYLYWLESLILVFFDCFRIACARGTFLPEAAKISINGVPLQRNAEADRRVPGKIRIILSTAVIRVLLLLFYLAFIILFIGLHVTAADHRSGVLSSLLLRDTFLQAALGAFLVSNTVQLIAGYFFNGEYRHYSPRAYQNFLSIRILLMHVMIVGSAVIHLFLFEGRTYAAAGEVVYVGLFMIFKTALDIRHLAQQREKKQILI